MWANIVRHPGTPIARIITDKRIGFYKHLDSDGAMCYAPPIYKKLPEYNNK